MHILTNPNIKYEKCVMMFSSHIHTHKCDTHTSIKIMKRTVKRFDEWVERQDLADFIQQRHLWYKSTAYIYHSSYATISYQMRNKTLQESHNAQSEHTQNAVNLLWMRPSFQQWLVDRKLLHKFSSFSFIPALSTMATFSLHIYCKNDMNSYLSFYLYFRNI